MTKQQKPSPKQLRKLLKLQVREYIERYHPELRGLPVEISPNGTVAAVRRKPSRKGG